MKTRTLLSAACLLAAGLAFAAPALAQQDRDDQAQGGQRSSERERATDRAGDQTPDRSADRFADSDAREEGRNRSNQRREDQGRSGQERADQDRQRGNDESSADRQRSGRDQQPEEGAWLGVYLRQRALTDPEVQGALITQVFPASPAARAGLRSGDVVSRVNNQQVSSPEDLLNVIEQLEPRSRATLVVTRGGQQQQVSVTLGSNQSFAFQRSNWEGEEERGQRNSEEADPYDDVPPFAMQLEHDRRMAEQHERIERELQKLQEEVRQLRALIERR